MFDTYPGRAPKLRRTIQERGAVGRGLMLLLETQFRADTIITAHHCAEFAGGGAGGAT